ncbi:MAG: hypothetical protein ACLP7Q_23830 [Isosphaeraceae bacterium]
MLVDLPGGMTPNRMHRLDPARVIETTENLDRRVRDRFPESNLAGLTAELARIARQTDKRVRQARRPIYIIRVACLLAVTVGLLGLWYLVRHIRTRWEFGTITEVFESADAGFNLLVVLAGALWFLITIEARVKRKETLAFLGELIEFVQLIDVTQLYYTPEFYRSNPLPGDTSPRLDYTYLLFCSEMLGVIGNLAPLYTRGNLDDSVWRAASDVVMLANAINGRLLSKAEAIRLETAPR